MLQRRLDRLNPKMLAAVASEGHAFCDCPTRLLEPALPESAAVDFDGSPRIVRGRLTNVFHAVTGEIGSKDAAGPFGAVPLDCIAVRKRDVVCNEVAE